MYLAIVASYVCKIATLSSHFCLTPSMQSLSQSLPGGIPVDNQMHGDVHTGQ